MSYKLKYTGEQIDDILDRAVEGGAIDDALALKAPLESPALTGTPTAPTPAEGDDSTKVATTEYADRAADAAGAAAEAATKEYTDAATAALYIIDTASGSIASFSDGADGIPMRSVKASIEPVQDLHGYDNPWPPAGSKNLLEIDAATATVSGVTFTVNKDSAGNVISVTVNGTNTGSSTALFSLAVNNLEALRTRLQGKTVTFSGCPANGSTTTYRLITYNFAGTQATIAEMGTGATVTFNNESASFNVAIAVSAGVTVSNLVFKPMICVSTATDPTVFVPYSNICPISGYTGAEVVRTGVNVWDEEWEEGRYDGETGDKNAFAGVVRCKNAIPVRPSTTYRFMSSDSGWGMFYAAGGTYLNIRFQLNNDATFTTPPNCHEMRFYMFATYGATYKNDISINYPSSDHNYNAYAGQTLPVTWETQAGEVFGGTIDVVSGELTVTHGYVDLGTLNWSAGSNNRFASQGLSAAKAADANSYAKAICSYYQVRTRNQLNGDVIGFSIDTYSNVNYLNVRDTAYTDAATFKTAMSGVYLVYELATPVTYHLDSIGQITSLLGQSNVWSNTGDTEVKYVADPKLYIAKMLGGSTLTLGSVSPLSVNRPVAISEEDLEQAGEVSEAVEAAAETVLPAESGETEEGAQE